jgi:hypothetical protein
LERAGAVPVLVDAGASGSDHPLWGLLAASSHFIGLGPDTRDMNPELGSQFKRHSVINKIVKGPEANTTMPFYLKAAPACSSMLKPNDKVLQHYLFAHLFEIQKEISFEAVTLSEALDSLSLTRLDWLNLDTQGCDWTALQGLDRDPIDSLLRYQPERSGKDILIEELAAQG